MNGLKFSFEKYSKSNLLVSFVMVVLGVVLMAWPGQTLELAARVFGIALLVGAAVYGYSWRKEKNGRRSGFVALAIAVACLVVGIVVLIAPRGVITLLPKLIGLFVVLNGVINLVQAMELKRSGGKDWVSSMLMAALTIALGAFLIFFAFGAMKVAVMVIGGVFIYNGLSNLWIESRYRRTGRS